MEVYIEPVVSSPHLVVVGRSPMAHTLAELALAAGLAVGPDRRRPTSRPTRRRRPRRRRRGHAGPRRRGGDRAGGARPRPPTSGWWPRAGAARRCSATSPTAGVPRDVLDRVRVPVGLDLGHTSHREIAVAILAELVQLRAAGALGPQPGRVGRRRRRRGHRPGVRHDRGRRRHDPATVRARGRDLLLLRRGLPRRLREGPRRLPAQGGAMLIKNDFEVAQPVEKVWRFFDDIPQVAACLPGAELTEDLGERQVQGQGRGPDGAGEAPVRRHRGDQGARRGRQADRRRRRRGRREGPGPGRDAAHGASWRRSAAAPRSRWPRTCSSPGPPRSTAAA